MVSLVGLSKGVARCCPPQKSLMNGEVVWVAGVEGQPLGDGDRSNEQVDGTSSSRFATQVCDGGEDSTVGACRFDTEGGPSNRRSTLCYTVVLHVLVHVTEPTPPPQNPNRAVSSFWS